VLAGILASTAALYREFFRMVLLAHRRPIEVLSCDAVYVVFLVTGAFLATYSPLPAATAILTLGLAAAVGGGMLSRAMWRHEPWKIDGAQTIVREIIPLGAWSISGSAIDWVFNQGYTYLVASMLNVQAVAALAATRLLVMPVNLLSTGVSQIMLPTASGWLRVHGPRNLYRRLLLVSVVLSFLILCYFGIMWAVRDWIFLHVLKKELKGRDTLLFLWCLIFFGLMLRDQLAHMLVVRGRMRQMSSVTLLSAAVALTASYLAIQQFGAAGALLGILLGQYVSLMGIAILTWIESRRPEPNPEGG
jgi:O-antigen/teichoic acid export membrane protein